jgi:molybdopterin biosynthesis enzyme
MTSLNMATETEIAQRIARLTPLEEVLARIDALVEPVLPREIAIAHALGRVLASDVIVPALPAGALALRDGWAVNSELTADASSIAPLPLPDAIRIDAGQHLPEGTDAVAPLDTIEMSDGHAEIVAPAGPGEGVLAAGADVAAGSALLQAGARLTSVRLAALAAAGISRALVREPRVRVVQTRPQNDAFVSAAAQMVARAMASQGAAALSDDAGLDDALRDEEPDAVVAIGGTGCGRSDESVGSLARFGRVEVHGIAIAPGETAAFGRVGQRPVLLLPGRVDAALAAWCLVGGRLLARLCAAAEPPPALAARLTRKVASPLGLAELIAVRVRGQDADPLGSAHLPLHVLARTDGWFLVPADREGYPAGTEVMVRAWP